MLFSYAVRRFGCAALLLGFAHAASASEILIADAKSQPESMTVAPGGVLIVGSASSPFIYKVASGAAAAEKFIDASAEGEGTFFFGVLADSATGTLWACQLTPTTTERPVKRRTVLRSYNLTTGAPKISWTLPGENSTCNDMAIGPDKAVYVTDTANGKIFRLPAGESTASLFVENMPLLRGIDGITFLNGQMFVNNVIASTLYRIPVDRAGKAGEPVAITIDQPIKAPDGMRAASGKLFVAENGGGRILALTVNGDNASVMVLQEGLKTPTGIEPAGNMLWYTERGTGKIMSMPMPK